MATNNAVNIITAATGKVLQGTGIGTAPTYSTATYPSTSGAAGNFLISDGTNWLSTNVGQLNTASITLTSQQIKNLNATPIELIPAPGVGKVINIIDPIMWKFTYGGTNVFVAAASQGISLYYGTSNLVASSFPVVSDSIIVGTSNRIDRTKTGNSGGSGYLDTALENLPINIRQPIATEISGNAANNNTITFTVLYYIATL